jgi:hypothetical protein
MTNIKALTFIISFPLIKGKFEFLVKYFGDDIDEIMNFMFSGSLYFVLVIAINIIKMSIKKEKSFL